MFKKDIYKEETEYIENDLKEYLYDFEYSEE